MAGMCAILHLQCRMTCGDGTERVQGEAKHAVCQHGFDTTLLWTYGLLSCAPFTALTRWMSDDRTS